MTNTIPEFIDAIFYPGAFMRLFSYLFGKAAQIDAVIAEPVPTRQVFHTFDYDPVAQQFSVLFCHGTSSAALPAILAEGIRQPQMGQVIDEVLASRPELRGERERFENIVNRAQLSMRVRREESGIFATWLGNSTGVSLLAEEMPHVVRHGGEVFAVAWKAVSDALRSEGRGDLPRRFENATVSVVLFRAELTRGMREEEELRTHDRTLVELASDLTSDGLLWYNGAREVRFMAELPPEKILWSGSISEALQIVSPQLFSPTARQVLGMTDRRDRDADEIDDL